MSRKVLLIEPDYKNKYPPMGLMKIATYYRNKGDSVRFYKGDLKLFAAQLLCEEYLTKTEDPSLVKHFDQLIQFIKTGKYVEVESIPNFDDTPDKATLVAYRCRFKAKDFPQFDRVCVTTLFTFYWAKTIDTINYIKYFCKQENLMVGGIAATLLPDYIYSETGIHPWEGLLNAPGNLDPGDETIIDELMLDYSILEEIDYKYPATNAYFAYMTRGCVRKCEFCAVSRLEPRFCEYIGIKERIEQTDARFGPRKDLLLLDNNVLASKSFSKIIDEIKACGFEKNATYRPESEYSIAIQNLRDGFNEYAYRRKLLGIYDKLSDRLPENEQAEFYLARENESCLYLPTATTQALLDLDETVRPLYDKHFKVGKRARYVDFNQGVDARLVNDEKMEKLSEINIRPLRIAFDHYEMKDTYEKAVRLAAKHNIKNLSNYLLYNYNDDPDELYYRLAMNIDLCEELGLKIYSFPMKYHPIEDPDYFRNRHYIGPHWNRKFIRSIQSILNSTKGKVGCGRSFFLEAFGGDIEGYHKLLWMPEQLIINREKYKYNLTEEWWNKFTKLKPDQADEARRIISRNRFSDEDVNHANPEIHEVLKYYQFDYYRLAKKMSLESSVKTSASSV
ncbi:MAG: hypothetical protein RR413_06440 [Christensenellaceae bacterium]